MSINSDKQAQHRKQYHRAKLAKQPGDKQTQLQAHSDGLFSYLPRKEESEVDQLGL